MAEAWEELGASVGRATAVLATFALAAALLLAGVHLATRDIIADAQRRAAHRTLLELFPPETHDNDPLGDVLPIPASYLSTLGLKEPAKIHVVRRGDEVVGFIVPATAPDGYGGPIHLLVGIRVDGTLAGVRVLSHNETPGLGDKVELRKSRWILSFDGRSLGNPPLEQWAVVKDGGVFDQFTGATITPRAVVNQVRKVLIFYREHRDELLRAAAAARGGRHG
ncbi:MAG: electron transport complex subunit G [Porticoccaceae bacterium]|nr:MAG: electron transport complex subunit G [Porticoccaceae bacterium]